MHLNMSFASKLIIVAAVLGLTQRATSAAAAPPEGDGPIPLKEARALVVAPDKRPGSTSLGFTNAGGLVNPASLPLSGPGYEVLSHVRGRATHFGTTALLDVIAGATGDVARRFKGARLSVGNLGFASGKKIPWSVSHQAGRDADLGMYARDAAGRPIDALPFVRFDAAGEATWRGQRVRFDVERNLALVVYLVDDPARRIQYIFIARWLKELLLAEAVRTGVPAAIRARLAEVLHQPSDSSPHADHFHIRLFCAIDDRLFGCQDRGPRRAWIPMGDDVVDAHVAELGRVLRLPGQQALVLAAVHRLAAIGLPSASPHLLGALTRPEAKVRKAALAALKATRDPSAALALVERAAGLTDLAWLGEVLDTASALADETMLPTAFSLADRADTALHPDVLRVKKRATEGRARIHRFVLQVLRDHGATAHARAVAVALAHVQDKDRQVAAAADAALRMLTCRFPRNAKGWKGLSLTARDGRGETAEDIAEGLRAVSRKLPRDVRSRGFVDKALPLLTHRDAAVRRCASQALTDLTGHEADWRARAPERHRRHWTTWWKDNRASSTLRR